MIIINITEYNKKTRYLAPLGKAVLKEGFYIASADEYVYKFLDKNATKSFLEIIHKEDRDVFLDAVNNISENKQYFLVRIVTVEASYKYMLLSMRYHNSILDDYRCIEIYMSDIIAAMDKHIVNRVTLAKYRRLMCLVDCMYFDYTKKDNKLNIYIYANDKSYMFLSEDLDVWEKQMKEKYVWKDDNQARFSAFCAHLRSALDEFKIQFSTTFFSKGSRSDNVVAIGSILFDAEGRRMVSGIITNKGRELEKPYYTTEASKDSATGLMNKRAIMEYARFKINNNDTESMSLWVMDIDNFKHINDNFGHLFGDRVIFNVAETIKRIVGIRGTVARFGGDEFVVILEDCDDETREYMLKAIYGELSILFSDDPYKLNITVSIGIADFPQNGRTYEELFKNADKALYIAKDNGKANCVIYDHEKHSDVSDASRMQGLKSVDSRVNRSMLYSDIIMELSEKGLNNRDSLFERICDLYDISGISVFTGDELKMKYNYGQYGAKIKRFSLMDDADFIELVSEDDMVEISNINKYKKKTFYDKYCRMEVTSNLISIYRENGAIKALVTFDTFNTSKEWTDAEVIALNALGKLIGKKAL